MFCPHKVIELCGHWKQPFLAWLVLCFKVNSTISALVRIEAYHGRLGSFSWPQSSLGYLEKDAVLEWECPIQIANLSKITGPDGPNVRLVMDQGTKIEKYLQNLVFKLIDIWAGCW